jgi:PPIC-type peptidyl-prolyl cis-trans isomerase-like protein
MSTRPCQARSCTALLSLFPLLTGCGGEPISLEQARNATVVEAAGAKLSGETVERWLIAATKPPSDAATSVLLSAWIDYALLATAMQRGPPLDDSVTVDAVILPDAIRGAILESRLGRYAAQPRATDAQVDSLAQLDRIRLHQQLQVVIPRAGDSAALRRIAGRAAELHRRASLPGTDFTALVREASEDSIGRANAGFLPPATRAEIPASIAAAVWSLQPGGISPVLKSTAGFHIFRRATRDESREALRRWLQPELGQRAERRFTDSVVRSQQVRLAPDAPARVRAMAREPVTASGEAPLASWTGGELRPARVRDAVMMLSPVERVTLSDASDSATKVFVNELVQREILFALAVPGGGVTTRARAALASAYRAALDSVKAVLPTLGGTADPAVAATTLVDSVVGMARHFRPLPGGLAAVLRSRYPVVLDTTALGVLLRASFTSWQKRQAAQSASLSPAVP